MSTKKYPVKPGYYDRSELSRLSLSLDLPGSLFIKGLESAPPSCHYLQSAYKELSAGLKVSDTTIKYLLERKHMYKKLEKHFNNYSVKYNQKFFGKAMFLLKHRLLDFSDISNARIAFELYSNKDGGGMDASPSNVLNALKLLERVMSPLRLDMEILKQQDSADFHSHIQIYEFMDLVVKCVKVTDVEKELVLNEFDFNQLLMTREERIFTHLDHKYKNSLVADGIPKRAKMTALNRERNIPTSRRRDGVEASHRQSRALTPSLEHSQQLLLQARNGILVFTKEEHSEIQSTHMSRQCSRSGSRLNSVSPHALSSTKSDGRGHGSGITVPKSDDTYSAGVSICLLPRSKLTPSNGDTTLNEAEAITDTISEMCEKSVFKARNALKTSFSSILSLICEEECDESLASPTNQ